MSAPRSVRVGETVPAEREPGMDEAPIFTDIRERAPEEVEKLRAKWEGERAEHRRWVYGLLGLRVVARRDEALVASGTFGTRKRAPGEP